MRPSKARYVTLCQQLLAVGVVIAMLGPAADVVSLDVVVRPGADARKASAEPGLPAPADERARVATEAVDPEVTEVPLEPGTPAPEAQARRAPGSTEFVTEPKQVEGMATVGVTWEQGQVLEEDQISVMARTRTDGQWSDWTELEYHDEHQPDPDSPEGRGSRPGTEPLVVGEVDEVQTKVVADKGASADQLSMAVVEPGTGDTAVQEPEIDTGDLGGEQGAEGEPGDGTLESSEGDLALSASSYTRRPRIYSRRQWGANESMRDKSSLRYHEVHAGFVHHTVNSNNYSADQVPSVLRSIYAYHTQSRGWSDIGYNFLVDRFGRVWEGRYGGVDRPVVGAHTLGYNDYAFAASAIGNFETVRPSSAVVESYGRLLAWKLSLHGVDASSTRQRVGGRTFPAINGHRDAGSTACPGRYLYAKLPSIRAIAEDTQASWSGRDRQTSIVRDARPDIVVRRKRDGRAVIVPTGGMLAFHGARNLYADWSAYDVVEPSPDLTGDGRADVVVRIARNGRAAVRPGNGSGGFGRLTGLTYAFNGFDQVTAAGDIDGDGRNDVVGRHISSGRLYLFRGDGQGAFSRVRLAESWPYQITAATGDLTRDGKADLLGRDASGNLWLHRGTGSRSLGSRTKVVRSWGKWEEITGYGDFTADGLPDILVRSSRGTGYVFPGNGRGGFGHWIGPLGAARGMGQLAAVDVDGGDDADILGFRGNAYAMRAHSGEQNTYPRMVTGASLGGSDTVLNVGDWDRDGTSDVITRDGDGRLWLRRGRSTGGFDAPTLVASGFQNVKLLAAVGDVTGDGFPDLMGQPGTRMRIYPGRGDRLRPSYIAHSALSASRQLGLGRWDGDGAPDNAFVSGGRLTWMQGNGPGGLTGARQSVSGVDLSRYDWVLSAGDVDGRNGPDLVVRQGKLLWLLRSTRNGGFAPRRFLADGVGGFDLAG